VHTQPHLKLNNISLLTDALLDSEFSQNRARGVDLQMQKIITACCSQKTASGSNTKNILEKVKHGKSRRIGMPQKNAWVRDVKSARPVDDEAYRLDLIGNITTNQLLPQRTPIPDDATAEERTMITAADSYHNLTEKK
jgi:hypothetical protein